MAVSHFLHRIRLRAFAALFPALFAAVCFAGSVHGIVTDASGARVSGASIALVSNGQVVANGVSASDGSFDITTGSSGRYFLVVSAHSFRQLQTPDFYAGQFDSIERSLVLEPEWVRQSIVVTATGTPTPQQQTSAATSVLSPLDLALQDDFVSALRLMPGTFVAQTGQRGSQTSLFVRGGDSDDNKVLLDGADAGDLGGQFDFSNLSPTAIQNAEVYRGPDSSLYGANADSGVVSFTTPHGTTSFPSLLFEGDAGNFNTSREQFTVAGSHRKLDYLGAASWLQTGNSIPNDEYHLGTGAANIGWQLNGSTQIRGTVHYGVSAVGVPNTWDFYHIADDATQKDQNLYINAGIDNQTTASFHNSVHYGATRKREQENLWTISGNPASYSDYCFGPGTFGDVVAITGANGYSATGQAALDCSTYGTQLVSNRDALTYHGDVTITPHLGALVGFQYENERGTESFSTPVERTNYDYIAAVHGDFKNRLYYTLGGSLERYSLVGTQTNPRAGVSLYVFRPRSGVFSGTRVLSNFGEATREPSLPQQEGSLYTFLENNTGGQSIIQQLHVNPIGAPQSRTYEGGIEQSFLSEHIVFRTSYFHNQFGREIESVAPALVADLLGNLTPAQVQLLEEAYSLAVNSEAFRAQGVEATVESGIGRNLFFRGGYTYLDAVVQRSFSSDNETLIGIPSFEYDGTIPLGGYSPLVGARPFRRPPHTGFFTATYAQRKWTGIFSSAFASRSDDSTYLEYQDANGENSLLLPNRNLDYGYAKLDLGGSFQLFSWMGIYAQAENLLSDQHIAPIGYPSLPMNFRTGLRFQWGPGSKR